MAVMDMDVQGEFNIPYFKDNYGYKCYSPSDMKYSGAFRRGTFQLQFFKQIESLRLCEVDDSEKWNEVRRYLRGEWVHAKGYLHISCSPRIAFESRGISNMLYEMFMLPQYVCMTLGDVEQEFRLVPITGTTDFFNVRALGKNSRNYEDSENYDVTFECEVTTKYGIPELKIKPGEICYYGRYGFLPILKSVLENRERFYIPKAFPAIALKPTTLEEREKLEDTLWTEAFYKKMNSGNFLFDVVEKKKSLNRHASTMHNFAKKTKEKIKLDPLLYTQSKEPLVVSYVHFLLTGNFSI